MKTVLSINVSNYGSTGNIMRGISKVAEQNGFVCWQAYASDKKNAAKTERDIIISPYNIRRFNEIYSRFTGMRGFQAYFSTLVFLKKVDRIKPDIIHLHNLHNNYIHVGLLFEYIKKHNIKVIWTLHDCWAFTGRCPYFQVSGCERWKTGCFDCPYPKTEYPSVRIDRSDVLWKRKKDAFTGVEDMTIVTPSEWLAGLVKESFLSEYPVKVINNGIDLDVFRPTQSDFRTRYNLGGGVLILLGVSFEWSYYKGLDVFVELSRILDPVKYRIVLVGVDESHRVALPENVIALGRTHDKRELAEIYTAADIFINPTREEVLGMVNVEAIACGTPVVAFDTGGCSEAIQGSGIITSDKSALAILNCIRRLEEESIEFHADLKKFDMKRRFWEYAELFDQSIKTGEGEK